MAADEGAVTSFVHATVGPPRAHWIGNGFLIRRYIVRRAELLARVSPFLLLDHHAPFVYPPTTFERGLDAHPHRGFETVTVVFEGRLAHRDSRGATGTIGPGDVQWLTAGSGTLHREVHEASFARAGGRLHMLQFWVNLPAAHKMTAPRSQALTAAAIPTVALAHGGGTVRVIAGDFGGTGGAAATFTPLRILDARIARGGALPLTVEAAHTVAALVIDGDVHVAGHHVRGGEFVLFERGGHDVVIAATSPRAHVFVLSGAPIDEPLVTHGPFVMNAQDEIRAAYADYKAGRFGSVE